MIDQLDAADAFLDKWMQAQAQSDAAATEHKHRTSAEIEAHASSKGIGRAKEFVQGSESWYQRQRAADSAAVLAQHARMRYEMAIRRWETERSLFAAGKRVI